MREAELEYEWVADLTMDSTDEGEIAGHVTAFHSFLDEEGHRALLLQEGGASKLRAIVRAEIKVRRSARRCEFSPRALRSLAAESPASASG